MRNRTNGRNKQKYRSCQTIEKTVNIENYTYSNKRHDLEERGEKNCGFNSHFDSLAEEKLLDRL